MTIGLQEFNLGLKANPSQFRVEQGRIAYTLCNSGGRLLDELHATQQSDPELKAGLRNWGLFALQINGQLRVISEPPFWMRSNGNGNGNGNGLNPANDYALAHKPESEEMPEDLLDALPTLDRFKDSQGFLELMRRASKEISALHGVGIFLHGSSVIPYAPLFSTRNPYTFSDIDILIGVARPFPTDHERYDAVKQYETTCFPGQQTLIYDGREITVSVSVTVFGGFSRDTDLSGFICSPYFIPNGENGLVGKKSPHPGGLWRTIGSGPKYHRYLSDKFNIWGRG
jgi:hypothetical protein